MNISALSKSYCVLIKIIVYFSNLRVSTTLLLKTAAMIFQDFGQFVYLPVF